MKIGLSSDRVIFGKQLDMQNKSTFCISSSNIFFNIPSSQVLITYDNGDSNINKVLFFSGNFSIDVIYSPIE